ncbi:MAG: SUMF1/EgtB/PvdO family nonheme iron enzyme, partial [Kiritimatiellae bacterium]|nr:SUMF1/EgtB/PvdO family nonheme iron enzyme [Kiritimatiellia bacterium]
FERTGVATDEMNALKAADFWWGYAAPDPEPFRAHAAEWYRKALAEEGLVSGLQRGIVAKRLAEFEASLKPKPAAMPVAARGRGVPKIIDLSAEYLVIDLSAGPDATAYPVSGLPDIPPEGWTEEYKTTKLVLRRIEAGTFKMQNKRTVTLTKPFYCGIFEVTQKQYEMVTGENPSEFKGDMRPVERVSYDMIRGLTRGAQWPVSSEVDSGSFIGKIRARTGLDFDLPTEAQWEFSCRAGTTSDFNNGGNSMDDLKLLGRFGDNKSDGKGGYSEHTTVGLYLPNAWGLYDMHGNVWEWCLDWRSDSSSGGTDPVGASSGEHRVKLGGGWYNDAGRCTSSSRGSYSVPSIESNDFGFRLSLTLKDEKDDAKNADATSAEKPKAGVQDNSAGTGQTKTELPLWMKKQAKAGEERTITLPGGAEMRFRWCPAGKFMMGSPKSEKGRNDDETEHRVTLTKGFWMGETEVTQKQWESVMGNNPAQFKGVDRPVEQVSWDDCQQFCERVSEELKCGMRLPTEAEWEYACRAGTTEASYLKSKTGDSLAWHKANSNLKTHPVGQKKPNAWGLCDMYGNVWEWCSDWYAEYSSAAVTDPAGPALGSEHIMRGGSWYDTDGIHAIRSANRGRFSIPKSFNIGFRVVLDEDK